MFSIFGNIRSIIATSILLAIASYIGYKYVNMTKTIDALEKQIHTLNNRLSDCKAKIVENDINYIIKSVEADAIDKYLDNETLKLNPKCLDLTIKKKVKRGKYDKKTNSSSDHIIYF
jgi:GTPase involved in cell partitioning and DNA repair